MANVNPSFFQSTLDRRLRAELMADKDGRWTLQRVDKVTTGLGFTARRRLLSNALRLTRTMAPAVADALAACKAILGYDKPVEVFVRTDPMINASAVFNPPGNPIIVLSSRLIEVFTEAELRFVMGHELGHLAFEHFGIPMPATAIVEDAAGVIVPRNTAIKLYLWCQAAPTSERARLLQHLTLVAAADGDVAEEEFRELQGMATALSVPLSLVDETLRGAVHPLD